MTANRSQPSLEGQFWRRGGAPIVDERNVLADPIDEALREAYEPGRFASLPNFFAKVMDARSAVRFARRFGLLGYSSIAVAPLLEDHLVSDPLQEALTAQEVRELGYGDPLHWVLAQSRSVRFVIELICALQTNPEQLATVLTRYRSRLQVIEVNGQSDATRIERVPGAVYALSVGRNVDELSFQLQDDLRRQAEAIVSALVNWNTARLAVSLLPSTEGRPGFRSAIQANSLIETIWWHVGQWALHGKVRLCDLESCHTPFLVSDERQRFCPHEDAPEWGLRSGGPRSVCASRYWRKNRPDPQQDRGSQ